MNLKRLFSKLKNKNKIKSSIELEFKILSDKGNHETLKLFLPKKKIEKQKKITKGINVNDFDYFWELRDDLFKSIILKSFESKITSFLNKIHNDEFIYKNDLEKKSLKVIEVYYHYYSDEIYIFVEPNYDYYPKDKIKRLELHLRYDSHEFEKLLIKILDLWEIDYSTFNEDDYYESLWEIDLEMDTFFLDFIFKNWSTIKRENNSELIGFISYATGGLYSYDLDNQNEIRDLKHERRKYLENRNINIKSELS